MGPIRGGRINTAGIRSSGFDWIHFCGAGFCQGERRTERATVGRPFSKTGLGNRAMNRKTADERRLQSYDQIVQAAAARELIDVDEVRDAVGLKGHLVHRVLKMMKDDGLIVHLETGRQKNVFRWTEKREQMTPAEWARSKVYREQVLRTPACDRPRERLLQFSARDLRLAELLAILVRSGTPCESAIQAGEKLAAQFHEHLDQLPAARRGDLKALSPAVGMMAYCQIMAGIELGRRVWEAKNRVAPRTRIQGSEDARSYCEQVFARLAVDAQHEEFHVVLLNTRYEPIATHRVSAGTLDASLVHPREVFRPAIKEAAKAIVLVHNHPSGDPTPGEQDIRVTRRLNEAAKIIGIDVLDHIVVAARGSYSLRDHGLGFE